MPFYLDENENHAMTNFEVGALLHTHTLTDGLSGSGRSRGEEQAQASKIRSVSNHALYEACSILNRTGARTGRGRAVTQLPLDMY